MQSPEPAPRLRLLVVCDNYHTHEHADVDAWLVNNPCVTMYFTPTSASWLKLIEVSFSIITRQAIRRGSFDKRQSAIARSSTAGTNAATHSCGARPPTRFGPTRKPTSDRGTLVSRLGLANLRLCLGGQLDGCQRELFRQFLDGVRLE